MTQVLFQFPDLEQLAKFRFTLKETYLEMNVRNLTIYCDCSEEIIKEATQRYGAKVLSQQKSQEM